jgi:hypothetical protein
MPTHDIIDNREQRLVDHINQILSTSEAARFAVGYFFVSGLEAIAYKLEGVRELRLLIGNTRTGRRWSRSRRGTAGWRWWPKRPRSRPTRSAWISSTWPPKPARTCGAPSS